MSEMIKSRSYPESLCDLENRQRKDMEITIDKFKEKDLSRAENLASRGSESSLEPVLVKRYTCLSRVCERTCDLVHKLVDYSLEKGERSKKINREMQNKSYAGFYYFFKWFSRSLFCLIFTTLGTISGKEVGCLIKDHSTCENSFIELVDSSPHLISSVVGLVLGLITGQWIGHFIWDYSLEKIQKVLRKIEKIEDKKKIFLFFFSFFFYLIGVGVFTTVFYFFVKIGDNDNVVGTSLGSSIGFICAVLAYKKNSICKTGQNTPHLSGYVDDYTSGPTSRTNESRRDDYRDLPKMSI